uniref:Uncharacterized protein n=1 Tax=Arundo donax TaxID=35708 RepID=A0A0A9CEA3_ARUDO
MNQYCVHHHLLNTNVREIKGEQGKVKGTRHDSRQIFCWQRTWNTLFKTV